MVFSTHSVSKDANGVVSSVSVNPGLVNVSDRLLSNVSKLDNHVSAVGVSRIARRTASTLHVDARKGLSLVDRAVDVRSAVGRLEHNGVLASVGVLFEKN